MQRNNSDACLSKDKKVLMKEKGGKHTKRTILLACLSLLLSAIVVTPTFANVPRPSLEPIVSVTILSPMNATYNTDTLPIDIPLTIYVDVASMKMVEMSYSLNGQANVPIDGNTTLTILSYGHYNIIVYAEDAFGTEHSAETDFTVSIKYDWNGDGVVNLPDAVKLLYAYGSMVGDPDYDETYDVSPADEPDGIINVYDAIELLYHYGDTW